MPKSSDIRFNDAEYSIIVLQCLKRAARRPGSWLAELIIPRSIGNSDVADSHEVTAALEFAIDAVQRERDHEVQG